MKSTTSLVALLLLAAIPGVVSQFDETGATCTYDCLLASATMCVNSTNDIYACMCSKNYLTPVSKCMVNTCESSTLKGSWAGIQSECRAAGYTVGDFSSYSGSSIPTTSKGTPTTSRGNSAPNPTTDGSRESNDPSSDPENGGSGNVINGGSEKKGISTAAIIGIVVGGVAVLAIIAGLIVFCTKHKAKQRRLNLEAQSAVVANLPPPITNQGQQQPFFPPQDPAANYQQQAQQPLMQHHYLQQQQAQQQQVAGGGYFAPKEGVPAGNTGYVQELGGEAIVGKEGYYTSTGQEALVSPQAPPPPQYTAATQQPVQIQNVQQQDATQRPPPQQGNVALYQELPGQQQTERVEIGPSR